MALTHYNSLIKAHPAVTAALASINKHSHMENQISACTHTQKKHIKNMKRAQHHLLTGSSVPVIYDCCNNIHHLYTLNHSDMCCWWGCLKYLWLNQYAHQRFGGVLQWIYQVTHTLLNVSNNVLQLALQNLKYHSQVESIFLGFKRVILEIALSQPTVSDLWYSFALLARGVYPYSVSQSIKSSC